MIKEMINEFNDNKEKLRKVLKTTKQIQFNGWKDYIELVFETAIPSYKLVKIEFHGRWQGEIELELLKDNILYAGETYFGSCSYCDSLQAISGWDDEEPTDSQVDSYIYLALEIIETFKKVDGEDNE